MDASHAGRLEGRIALITGSARGQGAAEARRFVEEGALVVVSDVDHDAGRALVAEIGSAASYAPLDVTDEAAWSGAVDHAVTTFGGIDILVNNAGIGVVASLADLPLAEHRRVIDINLHGVYLGMRAVAPVMRARGGGSIVNISSIDGLVGVLGMTSYAGSKHAVTGMTRSAAIELGPHGIRVNSVHPGVIASPMVHEAPPEIRERLDRLMAMQPIARMGTPEEVANLVLFLASDESSYCTGSAFVIDGGHLAGPWREPLL
ncbi:MAG: glucose 1-dehydrogenase [Acidimicrobiales bacterium]|nr:glucose 1-dehydrogenase [Acidimicrobiales bacterium]